MLERYDVVDLGTKKGGALVEFFKRAGKSALNVEPNYWHRSKSIGFERPEGSCYKKDVTAAGFQFGIADLATDEGLALLPKANYYLAWHVLEHLPSKQHSNAVVKRALSQVTHGAWFRLPSFEQDNVDGEGCLRQHGMRFTWTNWKGHTCPYLVEDCQQAIYDWQKENPENMFRLIIRPARRMFSMSDSRIVPISAPVDTQSYKPEFGPKPTLVFDKPIVAEWEVIVSMAAVKLD